MPATDDHRDFVSAMFQLIRTYYEDNPAVYTSSEIMVYPVRNRTDIAISPDVLVALGVARDPNRDVYLLWAEGPISWVMEVTSRHTRKADYTEKKVKYAGMGVAEYFICDPPTRRRQRVKLSAFRLINDSYEPIPADSEGRIISAVLGLTFIPQGQELRVIETATGRPLLPKDVLANLRADIERDHAEAERIRAEQADARAEAERIRAEQAVAKAQAERIRAERLAAEATALAAEIAELRRRLDQGQ